MTLERPSRYKIGKWPQGSLETFVFQQIKRVIRGLRDNKVHMLKFPISPTIYTLALKTDVSPPYFPPDKATRSPLVWKSYFVAEYTTNKNTTRTRFFSTFKKYKNLRFYYSNF